MGAVIVKAYLDIMFITVRWAGCCRRPLRRRLMAMRTRFLPSSLQSGEDEAEMLHAGEANGGGEHRPLHRIQLQLPDGSLVSPARWGGARRWTGVRLGRHRVLHNPRRHGDCLFASFQYITMLHGFPRVTVKSLRNIVGLELSKAYQMKESIAGRTLEQWAAQAQVPIHALLDSTNRWGNTLDLFLLARHYGIAVKAVDIEAREQLMEYGDTTKVRAHIVWRRQHFFVTSKERSVPRVYGKSVVQHKASGDMRRRSASAPDSRNSSYMSFLHGGGQQVHTHGHG
eukprot:2838237-Amphidinium_carterae.1